MKNQLQRIFCILAITLVSFTNLNAQFIESITMQPVNPTTADSITFFVSCVFPATGCDPYTQSAYVSGNQINATALHCVGLLAEVCFYTDTFEIAPLPAGNYAFNFSLNAGAAPAPCTAGIVPFDKDTLLFTVAGATGISNAIDALGFSFQPNPSSGRFDVSLGMFNALRSYQLHIVSVAGSELQVISLNGSRAQVTADLPAGIYFCYVSDGGSRSSLRKLVIGK